MTLLRRASVGATNVPVVLSAVLVALLALLVWRCGVDRTAMLAPSVAATLDVVAGWWRPRT